MENKAIIKDVFDLGYIVELENGRQAELRTVYPVLAILNIKEETLEYFFKGEGKKRIGKRLLVNIISEEGDTIQVSQLSREEIKEQEIRNKQKKEATEKCNIGDEYKFKVVKIVAWGLICEEVDGYLEAVVIGDNELNIGDVIFGEIIEITSLGNPIIKINTLLEV